MAVNVQQRSESIDSSYRYKESRGNASGKAKKFTKEMKTRRRKDKKSLKMTENSEMHICTHRQIKKFMLSEKRKGNSNEEVDHS